MFRSNAIPYFIISAYSYISEAIIGRKCKIGKWTRIEGMTAIAEDVAIKDEIFINGTMILPNKTIDESSYVRGKIIM